MQGRAADSAQGRTVPLLQDPSHALAAPALAACTDAAFSSAAAHLHGALRLGCPSSASRARPYSGWMSGSGGKQGTLLVLDSSKTKAAHVIFALRLCFVNLPSGSRLSGEVPLCTKCCCCPSLAWPPAVP